MKSTRRELFRVTGAFLALVGIGKILPEDRILPQVDPILEMMCRDLGNGGFYQYGMRHFIQSGFKPSSIQAMLLQNTYDFHPKHLMDDLEDYEFPRHLYKRATCGELENEGGSFTVGPIKFGEVKFDNDFRPIQGMSFLFPENGLPFVYYRLPMMMCANGGDMYIDWGEGPAFTMG